MESKSQTQLSVHIHTHTHTHTQANICKANYLSLLDFSTFYSLFACVCVNTDTHEPMTHHKIKLIIYNIQQTLFGMGVY